MRLAPALPALLFVLFVLFGCAARDERLGASSEDLAPGAAARVGDESISVETVQRVARAQGIGLAQARDSLIVDALFAAEARRRWAQAAVSSAQRSALARALLEDLEARARAMGEATDADVQRITQERWWQLDRPASARTSHIVVRVLTPEQEQRARAVAEAVQAAVRDSSDSRSFFERAATVPKQGLETRAERLPPVAADGRVVPLDEPRPGDTEVRFDLAFAAAVNALVTEGSVSEVVRSSFGFHVIFLEQKLPELRPSSQERRALVAEHVTRERARRLLDAELARIRAEAAIEVSRAVDTLTKQVPIRVEAGSAGSAAP